MLDQGLREQLRSVMDDLSGHAQLRRQSGDWRKVKKHWGNICAICEGEEGRCGIRRLEVAHVVPVEEGGPASFSNLLLLCVRSKRTLAGAQRDTHSVGCHHLYDNEGTRSRSGNTGHGKQRRCQASPHPDPLPEGEGSSPPGAATVTATCGADICSNENSRRMIESRTRVGAAAMTQARAGITLGALRARRQEILRVASAYGASNIRVFGSVARGEADEASDVDLLVDIHTEARGFAYFGVLGDLRRALADLLGRDVDVIDSAVLAPGRVRAEVAAEAVPR